MSLLELSTNQITFENIQKVRHLQLTNLTKIQGSPRPIMFKIKTNKIDFVDAKPSLGYISGKQGHNQINVAIRSLNNSKEYAAKLQILYAAHEKITQEMVQRNEKHFDFDEYNQNYQTIKNEGQNDVKTTILHVNRKSRDLSQSPTEPQPNPNLYHGGQLTKPSKTSLSAEKNPISVKNYEVKTQIQQPITVYLKTCLILLIAAFLLGFLAGYSFGKQDQVISNSSASISKENVQHHSAEQSILNKNPRVDPTKVSLSENIQTQTKPNLQQLQANEVQQTL